MPGVFSFGRVNVDIVFRIRENKVIRGARHVIEDVTIRGGGSGANTAVAVSRFLEGTEKVYLVGCVGGDQEGKNQIEELRKENIDLSFVKVVENELTGRAYVVLDGENESTIFSFVGANEKLTKKDLLSNGLQNFLNSASAIVVTNISRTLALDLLAMIKSFKTKVFIDPGKSFLLFKEDIVKFFPLGSYYLPNLYEFLEVMNSNSKFLVKSIEEILNIRPDLKLIIKLGSKGVAYIEKESNKLLYVNAVDLAKLGLKIVDLTGCGDVFTGVFSASLVERDNVERALVYSSVAAGLKATKYGARSSPKRGEIEDFLKRYNEIIKVRKIDLRELKKL
ncbi:MAG: carbohydrate kinase family protein [Thermoproteota archaeon]|nr:carbohydrate kinase family protein [Candidatus Brockarchaeota archaeon]MBO3801109.1 carbohydrate kinase family protein [Candidatus Brockarchaeota archaeon]